MTPIQITIAAAGPDSPRNDTATLVELPDGSLIVAWHRYRASHAAGHDTGTAQIYTARSVDRGLTWHAGTLAVDRAPDDLNVQAPALCLLPGGRLLMACLHAHSSRSTTMALYASDDLGRTWARQTDIWQRSQGQWLQGGAPSLVRLQSGRLLLPFHGGTGDQFGQTNRASCFISDDDGRHWRRIDQWIDLPKRGAMEASVAELPDGQLVMSLRTQLGSVFIVRSDDAGETWSAPQSTGLPAPESCTCLRNIPGTGHLLLLWNGSKYDPDHHHFGHRSPLTMAISTDRGASWQNVTDLIHDEAFEFTNLGCTFLSDGHAAVTYWACSPPFCREHARASDLRLMLLPPELMKVSTNQGSNV